MYNRYIPQPDGSYRRNRVPDRYPPPPPRKAPCPEPEQEHKTAPPPIPCASPRQEHHRHPGGNSGGSGTSVTGFLRQLLPKDFDTSDLLIVILLLLMAGDCAEDQNTALLTLALYLFM